MARIEVPGVRPATFKLLPRAEDSFFLYRSSRKIGSARVEENGDWTARLEDEKPRRLATAESDAELLKLIGEYLLTREAREAAARPVEEADPSLRIKGKKTPEERLSMKFAQRAQAARLAQYDARLAELEKSLKRG